MGDFSTESLTAGIEACKKNIKTFEDAIQKERDTINDYYFMIETIQRKEVESKRVINIIAKKDGDKD